MEKEKEVKKVIDIKIFLLNNIFFNFYINVKVMKGVEKGIFKEKKKLF